MNATTLRLGAALTVACLATTVTPTGSAGTGLSSEQIARLSRDLTPLGAERAGNAAGTIPAWNGGITEPPPGYQSGEHHRDPYPDDKIMFTIDGRNLDEHRDQLSVGHQRMLETYPSFALPIYPTRRSAAVPTRIYDATRQIAATAHLVDDGNGVHGAVVGIPFPIPGNGLEVIWNHLLRYRGERVGRTIGQAALTRSGRYTLVKFADEIDLLYSHRGMTQQQLDNRILFFKQRVLAPARLAGGILLVHETLNQVREHRHAWLYNPGQRRVRRAPNVAYDNPGTASDGLRAATRPWTTFRGARSSGGSWMCC